jgi:hypothetical protein
MKWFALIIFFCGVSGAEPPIKTVPDLPKSVRPIKAPGIENMFALGTNVFSGSGPEGDEAFAALVKLGVKTIITVDGTKPDVERAHKHGLRYVHIPHGYDGISSNAQAQIVKAAETLPGPFYIHCHHGKHRGPAAAAVFCMAENGWTGTEAEAWLHVAGTATNYVGLYEVVRRFKKPSPAELAAISSLPEVAKISGLTEAMVGVDERWDHLKLVRAAGYLRPKEHPDIEPANETLILGEHFREAQRLPEAKKQGQNLLDLFKTAEAEVKEAETLLRSFSGSPVRGIRAKLDHSFDAIGQSCVSCHKAYRDPTGIKFRQMTVGTNISP